jgi:hypothetical protein
MVFQRRRGTFAVSLVPRGAQPLSGAMLVLVQVSSMKTRRAGSIRPRYLIHCLRLRATSGRSCSLASTVFLKAQLFGVDEVPDRPVIHLEPRSANSATSPRKVKSFSRIRAASQR